MNQRNIIRTFLLLLVIEAALAQAAVVRLAAPGPSDPDALDVTPKPLSASDLGFVPGAYYGKSIRVRSQVTLSLGRHAFVLSDEPLLAAPRVLVLVPDPLAKAPEGYMVTVVGFARPFEPRELNIEYSWLTSDLFEGTSIWKDGQDENIPVIIADSARTEDGVELVHVTGARSTGVGAFAAFQSGSAGAQVIATAPAVTRLDTVLASANPAALAGTPVALRAVRVQRVFDPEFVAVGSDIRHSVLVRLAQPTGRILPGDVVNLAGTIEKSPPTPQNQPLTPVFIQAAQIGLVH